ncbi:protein YgfX [Aestuariirhabdus litorea]|uniref:Toxin CptA n=1 Tax=Aestuariirhabdus litorea TaxID=2528527 RepID=A0A3P3VQT9_9GAMM|nr:protein YgfX [Aestuariirhabdus litorea]RRJ85161.1 hypothetical protein D0544_08880 [Aestuariirhabdus litorea]RWW98383.1 hypothetical protein DZC74_08870 [Endozoicomonadaceae bacterium GTF-13]
MDSVVPSNNRFTQLRIEASTQMLCWSVSLFFLLLGLWLSAPLVPLVKLLGAALLCGQLIFWLGRHYLLCRVGSVRALGHDGQQWWLVAGDLRETVTPTGEAWVSPRLTMLSFRGQESGRRYPVLLFADSADPEQLRRLRLLLRWGGPQGRSDGEP